MHIKRNLVSAAVSAAIASTTSVWAEDDQNVMEEITVTATRRAESIQDIPYNITALSGDDIAKRGINSLDALIRTIPGLSGPELGSRAGVNNTIIMRGLNVSDAGLSTVAGNRTASPVSTYINDTPLFSNFRLLDIERVEVLRGPQGTLYGSGAMGGTLRIITRKPDLTGSFYEVTGGIGDNAESGKMNYEFQGIANIPFSDTFGIRLAASYNKLGGTVDATKLIVTDNSGNQVWVDPTDINSAAEREYVKNVNSGEVTFFKAAALWLPGENTEVNFNFVYQDEDWKHGSTAYIGDDTQFGDGPDSWQDSPHALDPLKRTVDLVSLDVSHEFGFASFTSSTSYTNDSSHPDRDTSDFYETFAPYYFYYPRMLVVTDADETRKGFTQEFRLVSNGDSKIDWVAGVYYHDEKFDQSGIDRINGYGQWADDPNSWGSQYVAYYYGAYGLTTVGDFIEYGLGGVRPSTNDDVAYTVDFTDKFKDLAAFGEVTFHPMDPWQITLGARVFRQKLTSSLYQTFPYCGLACDDTGTNPEGVTSVGSSKTFNDSIFKFNTSWDFSDSQMLYFTMAQGFRRGGANALPLAGPFADPSFPLDYQPDKALNTEIGLKGTSSSGNFRYTAALFNIDWKDIQIETFTLAGLKGVLNGGKARSKGFEFEMNANVTERLLFGLGYSYTDAKLKEDVTVATGVLNVGDRLPFVSRNQLTGSADYFLPVGANQLQFHIDANYRSSFNSEANPNQFPSNFYHFSGYTQWNTFVELAADAWAFQLYVKNLTNESGLSAAIVRNANVTPLAEFGRRGWISNPRSIGIRATYRWE